MYITFIFFIGLTTWTTSKINNFVKYQQKLANIYLNNDKFAQNQQFSIYLYYLSSKYLIINPVPYIEVTIENHCYR